MWYRLTHASREWEIGRGCCEMERRGGGSGGGEGGVKVKGSSGSSERVDWRW